MARKKIRNSKAHTKKTSLKAKKQDGIITIIHGWMFIVAFALMLGIGAIVGTYFSNLINQNAPTVAGSSIEISQ